MTDELQPYQPNGRCPKCGHDQVRTRYQESREWPHSWERYERGREVHAEHLRRHCERCCYEWPEALAVAQKVGKP